jgi:hypothetical protein
LLHTSTATAAKTVVRIDRLPGNLDHLQLLSPPLHPFALTAASLLCPSASTAAPAPAIRINCGRRPAFRIEFGHLGYRRHVQH